MTTTTAGTPGPNDLLPCGTESARRRHLARNERCDRCGVEGVRTPASTTPILANGGRAA